MSTFWVTTLVEKTGDHLKYSLSDAVWDGHVHLYNATFYFNANGNWGIDAWVKNFEGDRDLHVVFRLSADGVTTLWQSDQKSVHVVGGAEGYPWRFDVGPDPILQREFSYLAILLLEPSVTG